MPGDPRQGPLLICEPDRAMQEALKVMLGDQYPLVFTNNPSMIPALLQRQPFRLLLWDLDQPDGSLDGTFRAILAGEPADVFTARPRSNHPLETLQAIRRAYPALEIALVAGEFEADFQAAAVQQGGVLGFITKPWNPDRVIEDIQILLGDKRDPIRRRILEIRSDLNEAGR